MRVATKLTLMGFGTSFIIVLVGATSWFGVEKLIKANEYVSHSKQVLLELNLLLYNLSDAVSTQRAYVLSGKTPSAQAFLDAYHTQLSATTDSADHINELVADNPEQLERAGRLRNLVKERLGSLETTVDIYDHQGFEKAVERIRQGHSLKYRISLNNAIDEMKQYEIGLLDQRDAEMRRSSKISIFTIAAGCLLALVLIGMFNYLFAQSILICIRQLVRTSDNIKVGRFGLSTSTNSDDEFAELASAFNTISQRLLVVTNDLKQYEHDHQTLKIEYASELTDICTKLGTIANTLNSSTEQQNVLTTQLTSRNENLEQHAESLLSTTSSVDSFAHALTKEFVELRTELETYNECMVFADQLISKLEAITISAQLDQARTSSPDPASVVILKRLKDIAQEAERQKSDISRKSTKLATLTNKVIDCYADAIKVIESNKCDAEEILMNVAKEGKIIEQLRSLNSYAVLQEYLSLLESKNLLPDRISKNANEISELFRLAKLHLAERTQETDTELTGIVLHEID